MSKMKILIDIGHGYNCNGKGSPWSLSKTPPELPFREWEWTRKCAGLIVTALRKKGYDAELLVPETVDVSLSTRVKRVNTICDKLGASNVCLVSIHNNAAGNGKKWMAARGWAGYVYTVASANSKILATKIFEAVERKGVKVRKPSVYQKFWTENFYILRYTKCPAVLTENLFQDNISDVTYLNSSVGLDELVDAHVEGIINYVK